MTDQEARAIADHVIQIRACRRELEQQAEPLSQRDRCRELRTLIAGAEAALEAAITATE